MSAHRSGCGSRGRIVLAEPLTEQALGILRAAGHEVVGPVTDPEELRRELQGADALIVRSLPVVDRTLLAAAPKLRVLGRAGVGLDHIDLDACEERGVQVVNTPDANTIAAAELTLGLLLAVARNIAAADAALRGGRWRRAEHRGFELSGRTLGIVGLGRIGGAVAQRASAFGMDLVVADPYITEERVCEHGARRLELTELLPLVDVLTIHTPLNEETEGLLDADRLRRLPSGAVVLNCARGGLVDEHEVLRLVNSGHLSGAGFDVFSKEPRDRFDLAPGVDAIWRQLAAHPRVVCTPHLGSQTDSAQERMACDAARAVVEQLARPV